MKFYERVISDFGGYEKCKDILSQPNIDFIMNAQRLREHMLEYRRQHNIFERNDYVVNRDIKYSDELNIVSSSNDKALWFFGKTYGGFVKSQFRHATDAEIKAGKRLEVNDGST